EDPLLLGPVQVDPPHRDGHHLGAAGLDGTDHLLVRTVFPGAHHQPGAELPPRDHQRRVLYGLIYRRGRHGSSRNRAVPPHPPPTKCTSSSVSPARTSVES